MITPIVGQVYLIHPSSGLVNAKCTAVQTLDGWNRSVTRYYFTNLKTGREIRLKSRVKIKAQIDETKA